MTLLMRYGPQWSAAYFSLHCPYIVKQIGAENNENNQVGDISLIYNYFIKISDDFNLGQKWNRPKVLQYKIFK